MTSAQKRQVEAILDAVLIAISRRHQNLSWLRRKRPTSRRSRIAEQNRKIAHLEEQLAAAQNDGSLFDLRRDSVDHIIRVMTDPSTISEHKARRIASGILAELKGRSKPGG